MNKIALLLTIAAVISCGSSPSASAGPNAASFENVTVTDATNMSSKPKVSAESKLPAAKLRVKDLVVGTGEAATPTSSVKVQYVGVRYADGKQFDSSWEKGGPISFRLNKVVRGFTQGIGGNDTIPPMKVGGRRIMIVPSEFGYGANGTPDGSIPPDATIVFVVDLIAVK
ncbi:MAG TPA: FKBP-type peptidyl-prolyl cis-trans isomerase [Chthoniobacterales bacterium]